MKVNQTTGTVTMNSNYKLLPTEIATIIHHVELNRAGWWDDVMQRLVLSSVWLASDSSSVSEIKNVLKSEFGLSISKAKVDSVIDALRSKQLLNCLPDGKLHIPDEHRIKLEKEIEEAEDIATNAKNHFNELFKEICNQHPQDKTWEKFKSTFLIPLIRDVGANAYNLISGDKMAANKTLLREFQNQFEPQIKDQIFDLTSRFLNPSNTTVTSYINRMLHAEFCIQASGLPENVITKLSSSTGKQIKFRIFVDTNFLFSILNLHEHPSNPAAAEIKEIINLLNSNVKIELYILPRTLDEAKSSIAAAEVRLSNFPRGVNFTKVGQHAGFTGLTKRFINARSTNPEIISAKDWFAPYFNNFVAMANGVGIKLFNENLNDYPTNQDVVDDIHKVLEEESKRKRIGKSFAVVQSQEKQKNSGKSYNMVEHDMILWHFVNNNRPSHVDSPVDAKDWILTLDFRLIGFDERKRKIQRSKIPICIHPLSLIQILQFWIPRTKEFEEAIFGSMRLPFLFRELNDDAERTSLRILKCIGRFEGSEQIPEESIGHVMLNEGLRARLGSEENDEEDAKLIHAAFVEEGNYRVERERQRAEKLRAKVKDKDSEIQILYNEKKTRDSNIQELQNELIAEGKKTKDIKAKIEKKDKKIKKILAVFIYIFCLAIILVVSGLAAWPLSEIAQSWTTTIHTDLLIFINGSICFVILHLILEICVSRIEPMKQLWVFRQITRFRAWLWSGVIITTLTSVAINYGQ